MTKKKQLSTNHQRVQGMSVTAKFQVEAMHQWKDAPPQYAYLSAYHRHMFHFEVCVVVNGANRQVEFIDLKHKAEAEAINFLPTKKMNFDMLDFGSQSCEMLAIKLGKLMNDAYPEYNLCYIAVSEDGENEGTVVFEDRDETEKQQLEEDQENELAGLAEDKGY